MATLMDTAPLLCIGSVLWDTIGRSPRDMRMGSDVPGRIARHPGGVAMNVAMSLRRFGLSPVLLSSIGHDVEGDELISTAEEMGLGVDLIHRTEDLPTDQYMAIEGANGMIAAIADAHSLETAGEAILAPLWDGRLGRESAPFDGVAVVDGNLTERLLAAINSGWILQSADLRLAPASPGKVERLEPLLSHPGATTYVNLEEAEILLGRSMEDATGAAAALVGHGASRVLVTHGAETAAMAGPGGLVEGAPPAVTVARVTGAGDVLMAAHIAAELRGLGPDEAMVEALAAAADYVAGGSA